MAASLTADNANQALSFAHSDLSETLAIDLVNDALHGMDDGELFLENTVSEAVSLENSSIRSTSYDTHQGFGLRTVLGEATAYAHSSDISPDCLKRALSTTNSIRHGYTGSIDLSPMSHLPLLRYTQVNPLDTLSFKDKTDLLSQIDVYARSLDPRVTQVMASCSAEWQRIRIIRNNTVVEDIRPLVRLNVSIITTAHGRSEVGSYGGGGRTTYDVFVEENSWQGYVKEALRQSLINLDAVAAPAGDYPVVLGPGWPGVLLHEAVGHGLEGDFNRKKTSAFSGRIGEQVAARGVTVVDDGTIKNRRGSLSFDDEGTPCQRTILIEDGILKGYMHDRLNARLMGTISTGNGRRESYTSAPMPRMTNTFMLEGPNSQEEMIRSVKKGIFAVNFHGGQVDITSGKFVFSTAEAYLIEDGKITTPVKGATLIGSGPETMKRISMIGNDLALDNGVGTCGKDGQSVPVGVGQPSLLISHLTIGGTQLSS